MISTSFHLTMVLNKYTNKQNTNLRKQETKSMRLNVLTNNHLKSNIIVIFD